MFVKTFPNINLKHVQIAGGKGASLGELKKAGFPVPAGFVVLAGAFERFLTETDLNMEIETALKKVNPDNINSVEKASKAIQAMIYDAIMPEDIANEIAKEFAKLKATYVAVRSSATAEDSAIASWAGALNSYLNVTRKNLLESVKKCWASLFTPRAIFYRFEKQLREQKVSVAVVVQKMVHSEVSGITFTVHPVTEDKNQMVIEAGWGLGEAIVGGKITPDTYIVKKGKPLFNSSDCRMRLRSTAVAGRRSRLAARPLFSPSRLEGARGWEQTEDKQANGEIQRCLIMDKNISEQKRMIVGGAKGTVEKSVPKTKCKKQKISDKQILKLAEICLSIEKHYKKPQDIEWAIEKNKIYILQARPITTLQ